MKLSKNQSGVGVVWAWFWGLSTVMVKNIGGAKGDVWLMSYFSKLDQHT